MVSMHTTSCRYPMLCYAMLWYDMICYVLQEAVPELSFLAKPCQPNGYENQL